MAQLLVSSVLYKTQPHFFGNKISFAFAKIKKNIQLKELACNLAIFVYLLVSAIVHSWCADKSPRRSAHYISTSIQVIET